MNIHDAKTEIDQLNAQIDKLTAERDAAVARRGSLTCSVCKYCDITADDWPCVACFYPSFSKWECRGEQEVSKDGI